jgi:hypothetical protein
VGHPQKNEEMQARRSWEGLTVWEAGT